MLHPELRDEMFQSTEELKARITLHGLIKGLSVDVQQVALAYRLEEWFKVLD